MKTFHEYKMFRRSNFHGFYFRVSVVGSENLDLAKISRSIRYCKRWKAGLRPGNEAVTKRFYADFMLRLSKAVSPIQMLQCKKLASYSKKLTCQRRV